MHDTERGGLVSCEICGGLYRTISSSREVGRNQESVDFHSLGAYLTRRIASLS